MEVTITVVLVLVIVGYLFMYILKRNDEIDAEQAKKAAEKNTASMMDPTATEPVGMVEQAEKYGFSMACCYNAEGMEALGAHSALQHVLCRIKPDTIKVKVVETTAAPLPEGWNEFYSDPEEKRFAVVWIDANITVAVDYGNKLWRLGLMDGLAHDAKVCRPPEYGSEFSVQVPYHSWRESCALCSRPPSKNSRFEIGKYPIRKLEEGTVFDEYSLPERSMLVAPPTGKVKVSFEMVPTPKGSQAKPHIIVLFNDVKCAEFDGRSTSYNEYLKLRDCKIYSSKVVALDSRYGGKYYRLHVIRSAEPVSD